jgi:hypothetical protein
MALLGPLAALLGLELDVLMERLRRNATTYGLLALFLAIGGVFLLVAAQVALSMWIGPLWAALTLAGVALLVALVIWLSARAAERRRLKREAEARRTSDATALATTAAVTALPMLVRNPAMRLALVPVGAMLGYLVLKRLRRAESDADDH